MFKNKKAFNKKLLIPLVVIILVGAGVGSYLFLNRDTDDKNPVSTVEVANQDINYDPPTEQELKEAEQLQQNRESNSNTPPVVNGKRQLTPVVTYAAQDGQQVTVNAYAAGIVEEGGTCTATFTLGNQKVAKTTAGFANASTTNCEPFFIDRGEFPRAGEWQLVLSYNSNTATGAAAAKAVNIK